MENLAPISPAEFTTRLRRVETIARELGFVGEVQYRHAISLSGGASFSLAPVIDQDMLIVFAEAFLRDSAGDDFSLTAILAHERGHQILDRDERLLRVRPKDISETTEEVLASLIGALIVPDPRDKEALQLKAVFELLKHGMDLQRATQHVKENLQLLGRHL